MVSLSHRNLMAIASSAVTIAFTRVATNERIAVSSETCSVVAVGSNSGYYQTTIVRSASRETG